MKICKETGRDSGSIFENDLFADWLSSGWGKSEVGEVVEVAASQIAAA